MPDYPISPVVRRVVYTGSAGTGPYAFTFEVLSQSDIDVYINSTLKTLSTDYTVTINANGTGFVTLNSAPSPTARITIVGARDITRASDYVTGGDFTAASLNLELDQQTIFNQQNAEALGRAILAPVTDPTTINMILPSNVDRADRYLGFDENGDVIAGATVVELTTVAAIANEIETLSAIDTEIVAVANNEANIDICADNIASIIAAPGAASAAAASAAASASSATASQNSATSSAASAAQAAGVIAAAGLPASLVGKAKQFLQVKDTEDGYNLVTSVAAPTLYGFNLSGDKQSLLYDATRSNSDVANYATWTIAENVQFKVVDNQLAMVLL